MSTSKHPLVLTILLGWGYRAETANNAIALARKPTYDKLLKEFPNTLIRASEHFVGLPDGQMGNSEVGHLNIGAGRIVQMDITRIDALIATRPRTMIGIDNAHVAGRECGFTQDSQTVLRGRAVVETRFGAVNRPISAHFCDLPNKA